MRVDVRMKKLLSLLLCAVLVLGWFPAPAAAAEGDACTVTADCTGVYVDGACNACGEPEPTDDDPVGDDPAVPPHTHSYDGTPAYAQKDDSVHTVTRACTTCAEQPTETVDEVHTYVDGACVCGKEEPTHTHAYNGEAVYAQKDEIVHTVTRPCTSCADAPTQTVDEPHAYTDGLCPCGKTQPTDDDPPTPPADDDVGDGSPVPPNTVDEAVEAVMTQLEALPTVEELSSMTYEEKIALHNGDYLTADSAYNALTEEQKAQVDASKLMALGAYFADSGNLMTTDDPSPIVLHLPEEGKVYYCGVKNSDSIDVTNQIPEGTILAEDNKFSITNDTSNAFSSTGVTCSDNLKENCSIRFTTRDTAIAGTYSFTVTFHTRTQEDIVIKVNVTLTDLPEGRYTIKVAETVNGTVTTSALTATAGESITVEAKPNSNSYVLETLTVKDANGNEITVSANNTFTMPASNVTIEATFKEIVVKGNVYVGGVQLAIGKKYVNSNGSLVETDGDTYNARLEGSDESGYTLYINGLDVQGVQNTNNGAGIYYGGTGSLTIQVEGTNTVKAKNTNNSSSSAIYTKGNLTINGTGTLTAVGATATPSYYSSMGIYAAGMTINGPTITASAGQGGAGYGLYSFGDITISDSAVTASGSGNDGSGIRSSQGENIIIENSTVTANGNKAGIESYGYSITISGANANVQATGGQYALFLNGRVTVNGGTLLAKGGTRAIKTGAVEKLNCAEGLEVLASTSIDEEPTAPYVNNDNDTYKVVKVTPKPTSIPVWVAGKQVTSENMHDVLGNGTVSYDPASETLTLKDATINVSDGHAIKSEDTLTITGTAASIQGGIRAKGDLVINAKIDKMLDGKRPAVESTEGTVTISGTIGDITTSGIGINGKQGVTITGSVGTITSGNVGIYSQGNVTINGKVAGISSSREGIFAGNGSNITISGTVGDITSDTSFAIMASENISITGSVGDLKTQENSIYANGDITIAGTVGTINSNRAGIASNGGSIAISNSVGTISSNERYGITAPNGTITINSGAVITAVSQNENGLPAGKVAIAEGSGALAVKKNGETVVLAEVYGSYPMKDDFACQKLEVKSGATLTIAEDATVEVTNALTNNGAIEIANKGTLKLPAGSAKTNISGGTLYIGDNKGYQWHEADRKYYCLTHDWVYTATDGDDVPGTETITVHCGSCDFDSGFLSIEADNAIYDGESHGARLNPDGLEPGGVGVPAWNSIRYEYKLLQNERYANAENTINAGFYKASITMGNATAYVEYTIDALSLANATVTLSDNVIFKGENPPAVTVTLNGNSVATGNYTVAGVSEDGIVVTVVVKGQGNYKDFATAKPTYLVVDLPDPDDVEPDDKSAIDAYEQYKDWNETYKNAKLEKALKELHEALTDYDIIKGHKSNYVRGSYKKLSFTANGYYGKFTGVEVDGKLIDAKHYIAKSGSTIITLKTSYLQSLKTGKHTIQVNYTDGDTGGKDYFRVTVNNGSPATGDDTHVLFFGGLGVSALLGLAMLIVIYQRKKDKYQR